MIGLREVRFLLCTIAVIMMHRIHGTDWLFNTAAVNALLNLFTGQYLCSTSGCDIGPPGKVIPGLPIKVTLPTDPIAVAHYMTTAIGTLLAIYGSIMIWF